MLEGAIFVRCPTLQKPKCNVRDRVQRPWSYKLDPVILSRGLQAGLTSMSIDEKPLKLAGRLYVAVVLELTLYCASSKGKGTEFAGSSDSA